MTTTTKIFTVTTIKGKELEITKTTDTFEVANIVDHNFSNGKMAIVQFYANIKGKARRLELVKLCDYHEGKSAEMCRAAGVNFFFIAFGLGVIIIPTSDSFTPIAGDIVSDTDWDVTTNDDYNEMMEECKKEAENILATAKTTIKNADGSYMTAEQAANYTRRYNNFYNEGGEGFVPTIITEEAIAWAKKIVARNTNAEKEK